MREKDISTRIEPTQNKPQMVVHMLKRVPWWIVEMIEDLLDYYAAWRLWVN
jgi:hypothetical protein